MHSPKGRKESAGAGHPRQPRGGRPPRGGKGEGGGDNPASTETPEAGWRHICQLSAQNQNGRGLGTGWSSISGLKGATLAIHQYYARPETTHRIRQPPYPAQTACKRDRQTTTWGGGQTTRNWLTITHLGTRRKDARNANVVGKATVWLNTTWHAMDPNLFSDEKKLNHPSVRRRKNHAT